jgi:DNA-directed RNA polymerase subunit M/transcription elongation factor TFIIS
MRGDVGMSNIVWSRKCKKCSGQFYYEENEDGAALVCIQCGYTEHIADQERAAIIQAKQPASKKQLTRV